MATRIWDIQHFQQKPQEKSQKPCVTFSPKTLDIWGGLWYTKDTEREVIKNESNKVNQRICGGAGYSKVP